MMARVRARMQMARKGESVMSFKDNVQNSFAYLFEKWRFEFVNLVDDYGGNVIVAQSDNLRMRFAHDREDFFLDISQNEEVDGSIGFYEILDRLTADGHVPAGYKYNNRIKHVSRLLEKCFPQVQAFFQNR